MGWWASVSLRLNPFATDRDVRTLFNLQRMIRVKAAYQAGAESKPPAKRLQPHARTLQTHGWSERTS